MRINRLGQIGSGSINTARYRGLPGASSEPATIRFPTEYKSAPAGRKADTSAGETSSQAPYCWTPGEVLPGNDLDRLS